MENRKTPICGLVAIPGEMYPRLVWRRKARPAAGVDGHLRFNREVLIQLLDNTHADFGKHIIPDATSRTRVRIYQGYWEDIGTIRAFFEANLDFAAELPRFNFFDMSAPIFTRPRWLPASKINGAQIDHTIISDGCIISHADVRYSIVGVRSIISSGSRLDRTVMLGSDFETDVDRRARSGRRASCRHRRAHAHRQRHHRQERGSQPTSSSPPQEARSRRPCALHSRAS